MNLINPSELKDARINEVIVESDSRVLLHLRDGRAIAIQHDGTFQAKLIFQHVNPGGAS